jgi:hypothetical protein
VVRGTHVLNFRCQLPAESENTQTFNDASIRVANIADAEK